MMTNRQKRCRLFLIDSDRAPTEHLDLSERGVDVLESPEVVRNLASHSRHVPRHRSVADTASGECGEQ
jgi:hypothetical protein